MAPTPIYRPAPGRLMRVACFMSGSGTNARKIIERSHQHGSSYRVELIFTDVKDEVLDRDGKKACRALDIAKEYGIDYECVDIMDFYSSRGHTSKKDLSLRPDFDRQVVAAIEKHSINLIALAGYMSITTKPLLDRYDGGVINVHPADLTIMASGERKYVGIHTVRDAILEGEREIRATTHVVREKVDNGEILVLSKPVAVKLPSGVTLDRLREDKELLKSVVEEHQDRLKREGDWTIYPLTVQMIGEGRFSLDNGAVYIDGKPAPGGLRL
ncbi:MAG: formyltransferase family protein [Candidatus Bathyarchaeota archaeon]|nr:formyltransferase family protein [Candidatus Bathyarchaeota archaeon]